MSGLDNIRFIARIYGMPYAALMEFVESFAELGEYMRMPVKTYSSGMRARLMFGISLLGESISVTMRTAALGSGAGQRQW